MFRNFIDVAIDVADNVSLALSSMVPIPSLEIKRTALTAVLLDWLYFYFTKPR